MLISSLNLSLHLVNLVTLESNDINIYTDGSCHTQLLIGAWVALVFIDGQKTILKGVENNTTHNRMELLAVIKAIEFVDSLGLGVKTITVYSDSQYVVNLNSRSERLVAKNFITNKGTPMQNSDLVQKLLKQIGTHTVNMIKVKAHQKPDGSQNFNREADLLVRKLVRENCIAND